MEDSENSANLYLGLIKERDAIEQNETLTELIRHSFSIQQRFISMQKETNQSDDATG